MFYRWQEVSLTLFCHLQPNTSRSAFAGLHGERLKIRIQAPPVDGKANAELIRFLAKQFGVPKAQVVITQGENSRQKTVVISSPVNLPEELNISFINNNVN